MATGHILLPPGAWKGTDGSGSGNDPAVWANEVSSGTQTTNTPKVVKGRWEFDASTDQHIGTSFVLPDTWASGLTLRIKFKMASATSGDVIFKGGACASTDSSTADGAVIFTAGDLASAVTVPGTAGQVKEAVISLTTTGFAVNRMVYLFLGRDADNAGDTATGAARVMGVIAEFTTL